MPVRHSPVGLPHKEKRIIVDDASREIFYSVNIFMRIFSLHAAVHDRKTRQF